MNRASLARSAGQVTCPAAIAVPVQTRTGQVDAYAAGKPNMDIDRSFGERCGGRRGQQVTERGRAGQPAGLAAAGAAESPGAGAQIALCVPESEPRRWLTRQDECQRHPKTGSGGHNVMTEQARTSHAPYPSLSSHYPRQSQQVGPAVGHDQPDHTEPGCLVDQFPEPGHTPPSWNSPCQE